MLDEVLLDKALFDKALFDKALADRNRGSQRFNGGTVAAMGQAAL